MRPLRTVALVALAACSRTSPSAVVAHHAADADVVARRASSVLWVPGILGSELHDREDPTRVYWGRFGPDAPHPDRDPEAYRALALPVVRDGDVSGREDPEVMPGGELLAVSLDVGALTLTARAYPGVFEGVVAALEAVGTHRHVARLDLHDAAAGRSPVYAVGYDWRRSFTAETGWFQQDVDTASRLHREAGGDGRVDIVAHSMGTLLTRWYLRHGTARMGPDGLVGADPAWDPARHVRQVVLVAPPNLGEASVFWKLVHGEHVSPILPAYDPVLVASFPSMFEMLPRPGDGRVVWADDGTEVDVYDVGLWARFGWGPFDPRWDERLAWWLPDAADRDARLAVLRDHVAACLAHAARVHAALDGPEIPDVPVHVIVGVGHRTPRTIRVDRDSGAMTWADHEDGDGSVTRSSAAAARVRTWTTLHELPGEHLGITGSPAFVDLALDLLVPRAR